VLLFQTYNIILYVHAFLFCWHFSYRTCAFCKARSDWLQLPIAALHINRHRVTSKIRLTMPRVKMSRADRNPWLAKMSRADRNPWLVKMSRADRNPWLAKMSRADRNPWLAKMSRADRNPWLAKMNVDKNKPMIQITNHGTYSKHVHTVVRNVILTINISVNLGKSKLIRISWEKHIIQYNVDYCYVPVWIPAEKTLINLTWQNQEIRDIRVSYRHPKRSLLYMSYKSYTVMDCGH
jgi:hypothetical protein